MIEKGFILQSANKIILQLEDHMLRLQAMLLSKYIGIFKNPLKTWEKQLNTIAECLNLWFLVQRKWMYLESIFVRADNIRLQLPEEAKKFDGISNAFQSIMTATNENPNIVRSCCAEKWLETFQTLTDKLD
jgi:dynein heavy chain